MLMNFWGLLTIVFVLLRAFHVVDWSWWVVFIPVYINTVACVIVCWDQACKTAKHR